MVVTKDSSKKSEEGTAGKEINEDKSTKIDASANSCQVVRGLCDLSFPRSCWNSQGMQRKGL